MPGGAVTDAIAKALEQIDGWIGPKVVEGAAAAVWHQGGLVAERYAGDGQPGVPVAETTLFGLASVTKPVTAAVVVSLVEDGLLALDDPVGRFLPEFLAAGDDGRYEQYRPAVTIRQLLCHTGGLPEDLTPQQVRFQDKPSLDDLVDAMCRLPLVDPPGTELRYSNPGYGMLARVVQRLTGQAFWDAAWDRVFDPLGLQNVVARPGPALDGRVARVKDTARPGRETESYNSAYWRNLGLPWGGLFGTARDLARFAGAFLPGGPQFLSAAGVRAMTTDQAQGVPGGVGSLNLRWSRAYWGLGWEVKGTKERHWTGELTSPRTFCHFGAAGTLVWADPDWDLALAVFGNRTTYRRWPFRPPALVPIERFPRRRRHLSRPLVFVTIPARTAGNVRRGRGEDAATRQYGVQTGATGHRARAVAGRARRRPAPRFCRFHRRPGDRRGVRIPLGQ